MNIIYAQYFQGAKRKGNQEPKFLDRVNGAFIGLVATAIRHCLKAWRAGILHKQALEFNYEPA